MGHSLSKYSQRNIDISGPEGNAYALMAHATKIGKQLDIDTKPIIAEMTSGDYNNLLQVFIKNFGHVVTLVDEDGDPVDQVGAPS